MVQWAVLAHPRATSLAGEARLGVYPQASGSGVPPGQRRVPQIARYASQSLGPDIERDTALARPSATVAVEGALGFQLNRE